MDLIKHVSGALFKSRRPRIFLVLFVLGTLLAVVSATAVVVSSKRQNNMGPTSTVFLPLYIYPVPGAWDPLDHVINQYPSLGFTVVINPDSGPGGGPTPDVNYTREITKLSIRRNVRLLGYVPTNYANRDISDVYQDIQTYANWPTAGLNPTLAVHGIFFDETPQQYDDASMTYLRDLTRAVKRKGGLGPDNFVVHNPGAVPDSRYLETADSTVILEDTYDTFLERQGADMLTNISHGNRSQVCAIVHSAPNFQNNNNQMREFIKQLRGVANEMFVTDLSENYYSSFSGAWGDFVALMAAS
ncbi:hypothetical protein Egran_04418 [Elaphomyces granulatus]|uniref:Spherulin 4-like cell surface protein n=1 Tax=Elaphomyces granulatus TaxID=519963 RepID=A0A232LUQ8_9EURO|nr:hypothetical protein Egran_04418 [Elaphomyces granulatus]